MWYLSKLLWFPYTQLIGNFHFLISTPIIILSPENLSEMTSHASPEKQYKWKTIQCQIILSGPPQKPTHSEMTSCEQLHFNYYQLTSFLLWFSCFIGGGVFCFFLIKWNPLACQTFYKCLSIFYEFFAFLSIKMLLWLKYKVFCENTISHKGRLS